MSLCVRPSPSPVKNISLPTTNWCIEPLISLKLQRRKGLDFFFIGHLLAFLICYMRYVSKGARGQLKKLAVLSIFSSLCLTLVLKALIKPREFFQCTTQQTAWQDKLELPTEHHASLRLLMGTRSMREHRGDVHLHVLQVWEAVGLWSRTESPGPAAGSRVGSMAGWEGQTGSITPWMGGSCDVSLLAPDAS